ncbi:MAG: hypothetical protein ACYDH5_16800 [Acidimicrobiales bacterium]
MKSSLDVKAAFKEGWLRFRSEPGVLVLSTLVLLIASSLAGIFDQEMVTRLGPTGSIGGLAVELAVGSLIAPGYWLLILRSSDGRGRVTQVLGGAPYALAYLGTSLLVALAALAGLILLVVPGIIVISGLCLAPVLVVDARMGPISALRTSWELTTGNKPRLLLLGLAAIAINFAGLLAFRVGLLLTLPWTYLAFTDAYHQLTRGNGGPAASHSAAGLAG